MKHKQLQIICCRRFVGQLRDEASQYLIALYSAFLTVLAGAAQQISYNYEAV